MLQKIKISEYTTVKNIKLEDFEISYEVFGQSLHSAPIVLVNHALTGNSTVCGEHGWWKGLVGAGKCINTDQYTVLSFNIPGNGFDKVDERLLSDYKIFNARDVATIFAKGLEVLAIEKLYAVIGGSVGGGIAWELAVLKPSLITHLIPIATDWKSTDWLKANCLVQEQILLNSSNPVHDARLHAMLMYRTPESLSEKFNRDFNAEKEIFQVESWLMHHGKKLKERFTVAAYKMLNHILANIDITTGRGGFSEVVASIQSDIHIISVDSDVFFTAKEDKTTFAALRKVKKNVTHSFIHSIHGHDAFLIEFEQLNELLKGIFKEKNNEDFKVWRKISS